MKRILVVIGKIMLVLLIAVVGAAAILIGYLTVREYKPDDLTALGATQGERALAVGDALTVMSFNTGYGGLGKDSDFFMDGGKMVMPASKDNVTGIQELLSQHKADAYLLQEVDLYSTRSGYENQAELYGGHTGMQYAFAYNYFCEWVPYPIPMIGRVESGLQTLTAFSTLENQRVQLPVPFSWPLRVANLKRCLLVSYIPIEGSDKQLVFINLHLEAYDSGEGKKAQMQMLADILAEEAGKGNYVIAGGDFNQIFEGTEQKYPIKLAEYFAPGELKSEELPEGFSFVFDDETPTCRLLNQAYEKDSELTQYYVIDGFIVSGNVAVEAVETIDAGFAYSDHQPVLLRATLK